MIIPTRQRRFNDAKARPRKFKTISPDNASVLEGRSVFQHYVVEPSEHEFPLLKSGFNSIKLGKVITKGKWKHMPIYSLTLEERATCPSSCKQWTICYGNNMHFAKRFAAGSDLEEILEYDLFELNEKHPEGFAVRLHVLGDFYSVPYLMKWIYWLDLFPSLHVFGFTAWEPDSEIGIIIKRTQERIWDHFAVRFSGSPAHHGTIVVKNGHDVPDDVILCPFETGATACCATCGLCWNSRQPIAFIEH